MLHLVAVDTIREPLEVMIVTQGLLTEATLLVQVDQVLRAEAIRLPEAHQVAREATHLPEVVLLAAEAILHLEVRLHPDLLVVERVARLLQVQEAVAHHPDQVEAGIKN